MGNNAEKRRFPRYKNLGDPPYVTVNLPLLTDGLVSPDNFSEFGFCIISPKEVEVGDAFLSSVQLGVKEFENLEARVAWVEEFHMERPAWRVGFYLDVPKEQLFAFTSAMARIPLGKREAV